MVRSRRAISWWMVLNSVGIVYSVSIVAGLTLAVYNVRPQSHPIMFPLLALGAEAGGVALALRVACTTHVSYLLTLGTGLWLVSGTSVFVGAQSVQSWVSSSIFVALSVLLGRLLLATDPVTPPLDLSLKGIIRDRNSGLLGHRAGRSML